MVTLYGGVSDGGGSGYGSFGGGSGGGGLYNLGVGLGSLIGGVIGNSGGYSGGSGGAIVVPVQPNNPPPGTPVVPIVDPGLPTAPVTNNEVHNNSYSLPSSGGMSGVGPPQMIPLNPLALGFVNPLNLYAPTVNPNRGAKVNTTPINTNPSISLGGGGGGDNQGAMISPARTPIPQGENGGKAGPEGGSPFPIDRTPINLFGRADQNAPRMPAPPPGPRGPIPMPMGGGGPMPIVPPPMPRPPAPPPPGTASVTPTARYPRRIKRKAPELAEQIPEADMPPVAPPRPGTVEAEAPTEEPLPQEEPRKIEGTNSDEAPSRPEKPVRFPGRTMPPARGVNNPVYDQDYTKDTPEGEAIAKNRRDEIKYLQGWLNNNEEPAKTLEINAGTYERMLRANMNTRPQGLANLFHYKFHTGTPANMRNAAARTPRALAAAWAKSHSDSAAFKAAQDRWTHNRDRYEDLINEDRKETADRQSEIRRLQAQQADDQVRQQQKLRDDYTDMLGKMPPGPRKDALIQKLGDAGIFRPDELDLIANNYDAEGAEERSLDIAQKRANLAAMPQKQEAARVRMELNQQRLANNEQMNKINLQLKRVQLQTNSAKFKMLPAQQQLKLLNQQADLQKKLFDISQQDDKARMMQMNLEAKGAYIDSVYSNPMNDVAAGAGRGLTGDEKKAAIDAKRADIQGRQARAAGILNNRPAQNPNQFRDYYNKARELMDGGKSRAEVQKLLGTRANLDQLEAAYGRL